MFGECAMGLELNNIYNMSCLDGMKILDNNSVDAVVTDPPYELGFMGKSWDNTGIAYNIELWKQVLRVLKPGGHLLSFGGSRTYHRMVCAIEDAGFQIRDTIMWVYGSGFPKSLNIGKAVDKLQGNEREVVGKTSVCGTFKQEYQVKQGYRPENNSGGYAGERNGANITKGTSEWEGWGTALKPAHEPIVLARKPLSEKSVSLNVLKWGTGGLNIDACRVPYKSDKDFEDRKRGNLKSNPLGRNGVYSEMDTINTDEYINKSGRFPANLIHDGSQEVLDVFPETKSIRSKRGGNVNSGSASRFFYCAKASKNERNRGCEDLPLPEENLQGLDTRGRTLEREDGSKTLVERWKGTPRANNHPTVKPLKLMTYLVKLITRENQIVLDPFIGSGTTGIACKQLNCKFIGFELNKEYCNIAENRIKNLEVKKL
jgi:DNA modification methylase